MPNTRRRYDTPDRRMQFDKISNLRDVLPGAVFETIESGDQARAVNFGVTVDSDVASLRRRPPAGDTAVYQVTYCSTGCENNQTTGHARRGGYTASKENS